MREHVGHGEVGRRTGGDEGVRPGAGAPGHGPAPGSAGERRVGRRRERGPRPVRPGRPVATVRPPEVPRPLDLAARPAQEWWPASGPRVLVRRAVPRCGFRYRLRRVVAAGALVVASAAAVVVLGLLARVTEPGAAQADAVVVTVADGHAPAPVVVTAEPGETVWDVVSRVAPELSGPRRAALVERVVADNALSSVRLRPGQVLRVATG